MSSDDALDRARESFERRAWGTAYEQLSAAERSRGSAGTRGTW